MLTSIISQLQGKSLKSTLMRGGIASIAIRIFGLCFSLLTAIVLARVLGPEQYGVYSYVLAIVSILAIPAMFGLPSLIVRETAKAEVKQEWGKMRGLWFWANSITASLSVVIAIIAALVLWFNRENFTEMQFFTFAWGIAFIPLSALAALRGASLRGLRKVIQGQLPEQVLKPALFILMLVAVGLTGFTQLTAESAMMLNALSAGVAFMFGAWLLLRVKPKRLNSIEKEFERKAWIASVIPLALYSSIVVLNNQVDLVMLGILGTDADVGIYRIASQGAVLISIALEAMNAITSPHFSRLYAQKNMAAFQELTTQSTRLSFSFALPSAIILIVFGQEILSFVFGDAYLLGYITLVILVLSQVIHTGVGVAAPLLNMSGYEKVSMYILGSTVICNVVLNFVLIPLYGMEGAAVATAIAILIRKIILWITAYRVLGVDTSFIGMFYDRKKIIFKG